MQKFEFLRQPLLGELAMSRKKEEERKKEREKNAIYIGHLRLCQQPRAAHALRSDQCVLIEGNHRVFATIVRPLSKLSAVSYWYTTGLWRIVTNALLAIYTSYSPSLYKMCSARASTNYWVATLPIRWDRWQEEKRADTANWDCSLHDFRSWLE